MSKKTRRSWRRAEPFASRKRLRKAECFAIEEEWEKGENMQSFKQNFATRAIAWVLAFVMVFTMIPYSAFAAGEAGEGKLEMAPANVPTGVKDAAPPIESSVSNDSRNAVHAFVGVQTAGNLNDLIPKMTGQQFIPMEGIEAYFQWFEDGGYVSPIYTATSDANGRLNIGCTPFLAPDGKFYLH